MLFTYEHNQILFHITPCHDGSHYEKFKMQTLRADPKSACNSHEMSCETYLHAC